VTQRRLNKIKACLEKRQPDLTVVTDNVHKPHNVSAIMRTCDAVGVHEFHVAMRADESFRARSGIAMGSDKWLDLHLYDAIEPAVTHLQGRNFRVVAVHKSDRSEDFRALNYCEPTAVLFGAELFGVSEAAARVADHHVSIPMLGMVESYNVSVAAAIVLLEAQRQRMLAGMYDHRRLSETQYRRTLFRWYRPVEARYCDEHGIDYPEIDEAGQLTDPEKFAEIRSGCSNNESN
jgi:tRNA (guanosine-2'-O-)-methyltransferase